MSSDVIEPPLGPSQPDPTQPAPKPPEAETHAAPAEMPAYSSGSGDELNRLLDGSLKEIQPDPFLGEFSSGESPAASARTPSSESFDAVSALAPYADVPPVEPAAPTSDLEQAAPAAVPEAPRPASSDEFPAIDLAAPPSARPTPPRKEEPDGAEDEDDELPPPRTSWPTLLLVSYASAVTLGLLWVLFGGRRVRERVDVEPVPAVDSRPDPGVRADRSRKVEPAPPLPTDRITTLGKPLRMGSLEATPLGIASGRVSLRRVLANREKEDGGSGALTLRIRLKNLSSDTIFAPMDEAFLREREPGTLDSFIETGQGGEIGMYPLAVASEWTIRGQEFRELRPGESFETNVVSASDSAERLAPEMTWRVRVRTGINQTDTIGVRFRKEDIKPAR